jgi:hypothetical protein
MLRAVLAALIGIALIDECGDHCSTGGAKANDGKRNDSRRNTKAKGGG